MNNFKPCITIPIYNHGPLLQKVITEIASYQIPIFIIDDGSNAETREVLQKMTWQYEGQIFLHHFQENYGKGKAVCHGLLQAFALDFTHALQIDADGQHDIPDIGIFLNLAKNNPKKLINGNPVYNEKTPKARLYGRKITNFWVMIETASLQIKDAMCGLRVYPLAETIALLQQSALTNRMGFDIDIIVRLYWQGIAIINQRTKVTYPPNGLSHFKVFRDNLMISWLHAKLCSIALLRLLRHLKKLTIERSSQ